MRSRMVLGVVAVVVVLALVGGGGGLWWTRHQQALAKARHEQALTRAASAAANEFAAAWSHRALGTVTYTGSTAAVQAKSFTEATAALGSAPVAVSVAGLRRTGASATATLRVAWTLAGKAWTYPEKVELDQVNGVWAVHTGGSVSLWHPKLRSGQVLTVQRTWGARGGVLDRDGHQLLPQGAVYDVEIDPVQADAASAKALEKIVGAPAGSLVKALDAAKKSGSQAPIAVISYRESDIDQRRAKLNGLKGVIYPRRTQPLAQSREFGQPLLGTYGPVTADIVKAGKGRYVAGDYAGTSGLQGLYDTRLAGTPGLSVSTSASAHPVLYRVKPVSGSSIRLSLSARVQVAAERALTATGTVPAALVAIDALDDSVLASADSPAFGFDRALTGQYPPGSTLKVVTTYALLSHHQIAPSDTVDCPQARVIDGLRITNYENEQLGAVPFSTDFAKSCNTAFAGLSGKLGDADLHDAATALGVGADWADALGVPGIFTGSVPTNTGLTDKAASTFGQGRTLASPVAMAVMASSVASGSFRTPSLVTSPAPGGVHTTALDHSTVATLHTLMRRVVTSGTGTALRGVPGQPVYAKTGTSEFNDNGTTKAHCWIVGWQGDIAFAVLVEAGKDGGTTAGPVAAAFLRAIQ